MKKLTLLLFVFCSPIVNVLGMEKNTAALSFSIWQGDVGKVESLLNANADPHLEDECRWNALSWAAHEGKDDIVELLLSRSRFSGDEKKYASGWAKAEHDSFAKRDCWKSVTIEMKKYKRIITLLGESVE